MRYRLRTLLIAVTAAGCVLAYSRSYVVSSTVFYGYPVQGHQLVRVYDTAWQATMFKPAAMVEAVVKHRPVYVAIWTSKDSRAFRLP
jgi:hypothetical protein